MPIASTMLDALDFAGSTSAKSTLPRRKNGKLEINVSYDIVCD